MVRGFLLVLFVSVLFAGCGDELVSYFDHDVSTADRIANRKWYVKSYVIKFGTIDPDAIVPDNMMEVVDNADAVNGTVLFNHDSTVTVESDHLGFMLDGLRDVKWVVEGDSVIRFDRYDWQESVHSVRYNLRFPDSRSLQWYSNNSPYHPGVLYVMMFNLYLK